MSFFIHNLSIVNVVVNFSSSVGQFLTNLAQSIFGCWRFRFVEVKGHAFPRGDNKEIVKLHYPNLKNLASSPAPLGQSGT